MIESFDSIIKNSGYAGFQLLDACDWSEFELDEDEFDDDDEESFGVEDLICAMGVVCTNARRQIKKIGVNKNGLVAFFFRPGMSKRSLKVMESLASIAFDIDFLCAPIQFVAVVELSGRKFGVDLVSMQYAGYEKSLIDLPDFITGV